MPGPAGPAGDGQPSPRRSLSPQVTPMLVGAETGTPHKDAAGVSPAAKLQSPARFFAGRRRTAVVAGVTSQGVTLQGFLGGLGTYLAHLWIGPYGSDQCINQIIAAWGAIRRPTPRCRGGGRSF